MRTRPEDVQKWALGQGHDAETMWPVTPDELRAWAKEFHTELIASDAGSFNQRFERTIASQPNHYFQQMLRGVLGILNVGYPLSKALSVHPDAFDENFITIVRYGELYGELDLTLHRFVEKPEDMEPRCGVSRGK